jgi:hypothetical protein
MKGLPGPYWQPDPKTVVATEATRLHGTVMMKEKRMEKLCNEAIGGILFVTTVTTKQGMTEPFIMVIVAPSEANYNEQMRDAVLLYNGIWEPTILATFQTDLDVSLPHCPLLGTQEGFIRDSALKPELLDILHDSQPLFFSPGELVSKQFSLGEGTHHRTF